MFKHPQTHRNNNLQYKMQQNVFQSQELKATPYIIKVAMCSLGISVLLPQPVTATTKTDTNLG